MAAMGLNRLRRCFHSNDAASRAAAGYLSLLVQRKVTQRKHAPEPPKNTCASRRRRGLPDGTSMCRWQVRAPGANRADARPDPPSAPMLGGGYGSQRQKRES